MNNEQRVFFLKNNIPFELTYNANGLPLSAEVQDIMKAEGKGFAYNATSCENEGHTISDSTGHCVECEIKRIATTKRSFSVGCVFIAGSVIGQVIKIGSTRSKEIKAASLNRTKFGNYDDWEILYSCYCPESGKVEDAIMTELKRYSSNVHDEHHDRLPKTKELFRCGYNKAIEATQKVQQELNFQPLKVSEASSLLQIYNFRNLARPVK